ncbi:MAG TPA: hypothetical protein VGK58_22865 [Lacipirellulaceae bacterium]
MDTTYQAALTPEQIAAITAGGGYARCEDPTTRVQYQLVQLEPTCLDDNYFKAKIEGAYVDAGEQGFQPLDMDALKAQLNRRLAIKPKSNQ